MWGKFFDSTFTGSMFGTGIYVHAVWGYVIANTNKDHTVELNPALIAAAFGCDVDGVASAIEFLCGPDPSSRSKKEDGRRLVRRGQFMYFVVNHEDYRNVRNDEERREHNRLAQIKHRKSASSVSPQQSASSAVSPCHPVMSALSAHTEADTDTDKNKDSCASPAGECASKGRKLYPDDFEAFYCVYPRKKNKGEALSMWARLKAPRPTVAELVAAVGRARASFDWQKDGGQFIPYPATWLHARGWEDEPDAPATPRTPSRTERLATEAIKYEHEPGFRGYERAVMDGEAEPDTWPSYCRRFNELLADEDTAYWGDPDFAAYKRAVLAGEAKLETWTEYRLRFNAPQKVRS
jgi:hypothetical protein